MIAIMERAQLVKPKNIVVDLVDIPKAPSGGLVIKVCNILMRGFLQLPALLFFEWAKAKTNYYGLYAFYCFIGYS